MPKFIQISTARKYNSPYPFLHALDVDGVVWVYSYKNAEWVEMPMGKKK